MCDTAELIYLFMPPQSMIGAYSVCPVRLSVCLWHKNMTLPKRYEPFGIRLSNLACVSPVLRPFHPYKIFEPVALWVCVYLWTVHQHITCKQMILIYQVRCVKWTSIASTCAIFSPNPMFDHLLEPSQWDDSNKLRMQFLTADLY